MLLFLTSPGDYPGVSTLLAINNEDLSLKTVAEGVINPHQLTAAVSPDGVHLAYITQDDSRAYWGMPTLRIFDTKQWATVRSVFIENEAMRAEDDIGMDNEYFDIYRSILELNAMSWSSDGALLAFNAATQGTSGDVYVLNMSDELVSQLTDGPTHSIHLNWSPDDLSVLHLGVTTLGTGAGYGVDRVWAAHVDGEPSFMVEKPGDYTGDILWLGWADVDTVIAYSWNPLCGYADLRLMNIGNGDKSLIHEGCFNAAAFNPDQGQLLYSVTSSDFNEGGISGVYLYSLSTGEQTSLTDSPAQQVFRVDAEDVFYFVGDEGDVRKITPAGKVIPLNNADPVLLSSISPDGAVAWRYLPAFAEGPQPGVFLSRPDGSFTRIADLVARYSIFSADGQRLFIFTDEGIYVGDAPDFTMTTLYATDEIGGAPTEPAWLGH